MPLLCPLVLEVELTRVLDRQGTNLFDIYEPNVLPQDVSTVILSFYNKDQHGLILNSVPQGFVVIEMDFGFPHHLLVEFLKKTLQ